MSSEDALFFLGLAIGTVGGGAFGYSLSPDVPPPREAAACVQRCEAADMECATLSKRDGRWEFTCKAKETGK